MSPINHSLGDGPPVRLSDLRLYYMLEYISPASYFCPFFSVVPSSTSDCDRTLPCVDRGSVMVHRCPLCTKRSTAPCAVSCNRHASQRPCRTEGGGHKPVFLQHFSGEAPGDSGASPREAASRLPDPLEQRTPGSGSSAAQGDGMASRWLAAYLQATTTRHRRVSSLLSAQIK